MGAMVLERDARRRRGRLLYSGAMQITVMEPFHSVFYAPHSVALHLGHFQAGGDFIEVGQPTAEMLLDDGFHLAMSMGDATGPVPFSSYMTLPDRLRHEPEQIVAFTRAVYRTQRWIATHDAKAVVEAIAPSFADIPRAVCERAVGRYLAQGTWARDPLLRRPGYEYRVDILLGGGFIRRRHRSHDLVDTALAERAMQTLKDS